MQLSQEFLLEIKKLYGEEGAKRIIKAFNFASQKHYGQFRDSGEEYISHPIAVAEILVNCKADEETIICGLLHDCLEDTDCQQKEILDNFGQVVLSILLGASKVTEIKRAYVKNNQESDNLQKMFLAMSGDARVALVKLADRLHNMKTLSVKPREKQVSIAKQTLDIFVPIAERLGMNIFKREIEDLCFKYLFPNDYARVDDYLQSYYKKSENTVKEIAETIKKLAKDHNVEARIQSRRKSRFGLFVKWQKKGIEKVFDIIAHRIIVADVKSCYEMLGAVNDLWKPVEGRIKDYIANPKKNLYMSLHTTVMYPTETGLIPVEIQIRTEQMHSFCEYGVAAHWAYKGGSKFADIRGLKSLRNTLISDSQIEKIEENAEQFLDNIKQGFYADKIFVFTPNYNVIELPKGSIPIDFAYTIHSNLGNKCSGAKVNDKMVPLTTELKTGDKVEILTSSTAKGPSRDWLKIVKSGDAVSKIKAFFKKERRDENIKIGRELLEEQAKRKGFTLNKFFEDKEIMADLQAKYRLMTIDDVYAIVGYGGLTSSQIFNKFLAKLQLAQKQEKKKSVRQIKPSENISINGCNDLLKKIAKCCNPIPGDDILGYISRGKGVTIHKVDCPCLACLEKDRLIKADWNNDKDEGLYNANFKVIAKNTLSVINAISAKIAENKIDILYINQDLKANNEDCILDIGIKINSRKELLSIINKIEALSGVYSVKH